MTTTELTEPPKHILIKGKKIKLRFEQNVLWGIIAAVAGAWVISALYYLIVETRWPGYGAHTALYLKPGWDHLIHRGWWTDGRHDLRDDYEVVLAVLFVRTIIAKSKVWDKRVGPFRLLTSPLVIAAAAFPIIAAGIYLIDVQTWLTMPGWVVTYQALIIGIIAGHLVRPLFAPVGNTVQLFFLDQALAGKHRPRWPAPPAIREHYAWMELCGDEPKDYGTWFTVLVSIMSAVLIALVGYGAYVREVIAK